MFFLGATIWGYKIIVRSPELSVKVLKQNVNYPNSIHKHYLDIHEYLKNQDLDKELRTSSNTVFDYLLRTKHNWEITITNETDVSLEKLNLRIINVSERTAWAVSSDFLLEEEEKEVLKKVKFQKSSGVIYLKDFVNIPPRNSIIVYVWGKFDESFWQDNIIVTYDGGNGVIEKSIGVIGFKAYIVEYFYEIFLLIFIVFSIVYHFSVRIKKENETST